MKLGLFTKEAQAQDGAIGGAGAADKPAGVLKSMFETLKSMSMTARDRLQYLDAQIAKLREQRDKIETALPHCDCLAEWFCRNIDFHRDYFFEKAQTYLHPHTLQQRGWSALEDPETWKNGLAVFRMNEPNDDRPQGMLSPRDSRNTMDYRMNTRALVALLAEPLKAGAKDFILKLAPETANGMRRADWENALKKIDNELLALNLERHDILEALKQASEVG